MEVLAIIPARRGSETIPNKNIRVVCGRPLLAYSIEQAQKSKYINRAIVSTDSLAYAKIAQQYGAEVPFIRPAQLAGRLSTDLDVFRHALDWLKNNENYYPEICVHLRPSCPIRKAQDIDKMIRILIENNGIDSVRSVTLSPATPFKMWFRGEAGILSPAITSTIKEAYNAPRQLLPQVYIQNASIDVVRSTVLLDKKSMTGDKIYGYVMDNFFDINTKEDLKKVRRHYGKFLKSKKR